MTRRLRPNIPGFLGRILGLAMALSLTAGAGCDETPVSTPDAVADAVDAADGVGDGSGSDADTDPANTDAGSDAGSDADATAQDTTDTTTDIAPAKPRPALASPQIIAPGSAGGKVHVQPALAIDSTGKLGVAWLGTATDGEARILFKRYDAADGFGVGAPLVLEADTDGMSNNPVICARAGGGFMAIWSHGASSGDLSARFRGIDADGVLLGSGETTVVTGREGNHWLPSVACDPAGGFVIAGVRPPDGGVGGFEIFVQRYDTQGATDGAVVAPLTTSDAQAFPVVAVGPNGLAIVAWEDTIKLGTPNEVSGVLAQRIARDGTLEAGWPLGGSVGKPQAGASLAVDPATGDAVMAGHSALGPVLRAVHGGTDFDLNLFLQEFPKAEIGQIAFAPIGQKVFATTYFRTIAEGQEVRVGYLDDLGPHEEAVRVATGAFPLAYRPRVAYGDGVLAVAWTESMGAGAYQFHIALFR